MVDTSTEGTPAYWARIAEAAEDFAGVSTETNESIEGYLLRTTIAFEALPPVPSKPSF